MRTFQILQLIALLAMAAQAFFIPHAYPKHYSKGTTLPIKVGQLFSKRTSTPFDYYKLEWCPSLAGHEYDPKSVGVTMRDTLISESPYEYIFGLEKQFNSTCGARNMSNTQVQQFSFFAQHGYRYKLYLDDLPSATMDKNPETGELVPDYMDGIPVGEYDRETGNLMIYNHL